MNPSGLTGEMLASDRPTYAPRRCSMTLARKFWDRSVMQTAIDDLTRRLGGLGIVLRHANHPGRIISVRRDSAQRLGVTGAAKNVMPVSWQGEIPLVAGNPFWRDGLPGCPG